MTSRLRGRVPAVLVDVLAAVAFVALAEVELRAPWDDGFRGGPLWLNTPLAALSVAPLALRTVAPRLGLALMLVVNVVPGVFVAHTLLFWGGILPMLAMVFTVARHDPGLAGRYTWLAWPPMLLAGMRLPAFLDPANILFGAVVYVFAWFAGRVVRGMADRSAALAAALAQLADEQAAREAAAVAHERTRIAAEMHDVVSHAVSLMVIQVGAARMEIETTSEDRGDVTWHLRAAERVGREALEELRRSLGVLRGSRT